MKSFSDALRLECQGTGVEVQTLSPTCVNTQLAAWRVANSEPGLFVPSPQIFAKHAVATLGVAQKTAGYWPHELQVSRNNTFYINNPVCWSNYLIVLLFIAAQKHQN